MSIFYDVNIYTAFKSDENSPRNSDGSIIELKDGSLLLAWQCFERNPQKGNDTAPANIAIANSYDNGATWVNKRIVGAMDGSCVNCFSPAFFRAKNGSIVLCFKRYTQFETGKQLLNSYFRITSFDEGETWSEEEIIWENSTMGTMNHGFLRLSDGALVTAVRINTGLNFTASDHDSVAVLRSEDDFKTFTMSNAITVPKRGIMEPAIAERPDGSLNMVMRSQLGRLQYSESFDGGHTITESVSTILQVPESCPFLFSIPESDAQIVVWNNSEYNPNFRTHYGKRSPLTMAISRDGLKTFTDYFDIETDPGYAFSNPSITRRSDGLYLLNYWVCKYSDDWLMSNYIDLRIATFRVEL